MIRQLNNESGYSLVEVMVAIMILAIAIIPMVGMFDMGLKSATLGGNYDKARALANSSLEKVKAMKYSDAVTTYKPLNDGGSPVSCDQDIFDCEVKTYYVNDNLGTTPPVFKNQLRIEVTVRWGSSATYTTTGFRTK